MPDVRFAPFVTRPDLLEIGLSMSKAQTPVRTTKNAVSIRLVLTIIVPKTDRANFVLTAPMQRFEMAAWAAEGLIGLPRLSLPLHWLGHFADRCSEQNGSK
jgi:hypothetical protein